MSNVIHHAVSPFPFPDNGTTSVPVPDQKVQKETILEYLKVFGFDQRLTESEISQFIQTALSGNLDPFKREIYVAIYGEGDYRKVSVLTGYQVYLKRAERTGKLDGWHCWIEGDGEQMKALVEIFRKDWSNSFTHEAYWPEAVQKKKDGSPTQFWSKQPRFQLRKVAIAQGFRLAFPDELGSLPYDSSELPDTENTSPDTAPQSSPAVNNGKDVKTSTRNLAAQALADDRPNTAVPGPAPAAPQAANAPDTSSNQRKPDAGNESNSELIRHIENLFEDHPEDFTQKHMDWIINTARKAPDKAGVLKMIAYTEKVIRKGLSA
jgi:phage recombination protein Bet